MSRAIFSLLTCFLLILNLNLVLTAPEALVKAGSASLKPGETATIAIRVENIPSNGGLGAYDIKITFNPSVVQVLDVVGGDSPFDAITAKNIDNANGWVRFNHFIATTQGPTGSITIARLKVKAVGAPGSSTSLIVEVISLVNAKTGEEIPRSTSPGSITIVKPPPTKKSSSITILINTTKLELGRGIEVQGDVNPDRPGVTVTITFTKPDRSVVVCEVETNSTGGYRETFTPDMSGEWRVRASWPGDEEYEGSSSNTLTFTVAGKKSFISISVSPAVPERGEVVRIHGFINPPQAKVPVMIYMERDGSKKRISIVYTNERGEYLYAFKVEFTGEVKFYAEWPGSGKYEGARSSPLIIVVGERAVKKRVFLPTKEEVEIRVVSNSTETKVELKQEERRITVSLSGPKGTKGVLKLFIPSKLLEAYASSIEKTLFLLDGDPIEPAEMKEVEDGYLVTIVYSHSTRRVDVYYVTYTVSVKVLDYEKRPVGRAEVILVGPISLCARTNASGVVSFAKVPAGAYRVEVYYGPKVGEESLEVPQITSMTLSTTVGKWKALYNEARGKLAKMEEELSRLKMLLEETEGRAKELESSLENLRSKYETTQSELETYRGLSYALAVATIVGFTAGYLIGKRRKDSETSGEI
ncbi:MAG: hypothetical protein DRJ43_00850 [Thermoprotei archaeon]|nr:MAG: hypothetical protein DRJ43_00850 [Thermoprotei archaeon]